MTNNNLDDILQLLYDKATYTEITPYNPDNKTIIEFQRYAEKLRKMGLATPSNYSETVLTLTQAGIDFFENGGFAKQHEIDKTEQSKKDKAFELDSMAKESQIRHNKRSDRISIVAIVVSVLSLGVAAIALFQHK